MAKVKICGITNVEDARWAANFGADYIGMNFWKKTPRHISPLVVPQIMEGLPSFVTPVAVFVDEKLDNVAKTLEEHGFSVVQLHGRESGKYVKELKNKLPSVEIIKAIRIRSQESLLELKKYLPEVDYFLLDAYNPGVPGGTGQTFNWELACAAKETGKKIFLAGGLTPENIGEAIAKVHPYAVDVASGVEKGPRRKDMDKMSQFIMKAKVM